MRLVRTPDPLVAATGLAVAVGPPPLRPATGAGVTRSHFCRVDAFLIWAATVGIFPLLPLVASDHFAGTLGKLDLAAHIVGTVGLGRRWKVVRR